MFSVPGENQGERYWSTLEFSQTVPRFSPGYEDTENIICFFYKLSTFPLIEREIYNI